MSKYKMVKLEDLCTFSKGTTGIMKATPGEYPLVVTAAARKTCDIYQFDDRAVCIPVVSSTGHGKKSLNHIHYQEGKFALGTILVALIPKDDSVLSARFLHLYLSHLKDSVLVPLMRGAANVTLPINAIKDLKVPLPPLSKQREIEDLFSICDKLQKQIIKSQSTVDLLMQVVLQEAFEF